MSRTASARTGVVPLALLVCLLLVGGRPTPGVSRENPPPAAPVPSLAVQLAALTDTVIAHETAWIGIRITNNSPRTMTIPYRSGTIPGEWRFEGERRQPLLDWPRAKDLEGAASLAIGPGETLYEVLSPESCFGVLTGSGTVYATCRAGGVVSAPVALTRRPATATDPPSALRGMGSLRGPAGRGKIQVELWSLCAQGGRFFDCDEALFTVAWDRMQVSPVDAVPVVDTLIARSPGSGWCRPALMELASRQPESTARRYLEGLIARAPGGVAEAFASELLRRLTYKEFPAPGRRRK